VRWLLGYVGRHFGFGRDDLLDTPLHELAYWHDCAKAVE